MFLRSFSALPVCLAVAVGCLPAAGPPHRPPVQRALIVAIAEYGPGTGWGRISADNDLPLVRAVLEGQGFEDVQELRDAEATRKGILRALGDLVESASSGDLVVFYYSGHGQQLADDGSDEIDGYDEALVPYDAPSSLADGYRGEKHLRDDVLRDMIEDARRKVGPEGHVVVFLDSCFSGTPRGVLTVHRGDWTSEVAVRGGPPLGEPRTRESTRESGAGFYEPPTEKRLRGGVAPYVVFSAARHDQYAYETMGDEGKPIGSLTYAVTREVSRAGRESTYRWLYERVSWLMARRVRNQPQVEGDVDALIFDGRVVPQEPYVTVRSVSASGTRVVLAAGSLAGISPGARIELHAEGTRQATKTSRIASGTVVASTLTRSTVALEAAVDREAAGRSRAFVTRFSFGGNLRLRIGLAVVPAELEQLLSALEARVAGVEVVASEPDVIVYTTETEGRSSVAIESYRDRLALLPPVPASAPSLEQEIAGTLAGYARNRALRTLDLRDQELPVSLELVPVAVSSCQGGQVSLATCTVTPLDPREKPAWHIGDYFKLRVHNESLLPAHLNVLDLAPHGAVHMLWPDPRTGDKTPLPAGTTRELPALYRIVDPPGSEVILLIASEVWIDMSHFLSQSPGRGDGEDLFEFLWPGDSAREDGSSSGDSGAVSTSALAFSVVP